MSALDFELHDYVVEKYPGVILHVLIQRSAMTLKVSKGRVWKEFSILRDTKSPMHGHKDDREDARKQADAILLRLA